jgi:diacylglycerol kinase family enzyme
VDLATVNGRTFVNNVSLGVYAEIVAEDEYRDAKVDTTTTKLPELLGRTAEPFDLQFHAPDGQDVDGAFMILVSNNRYTLGPALDAIQRRQIDEGVLGVVAISSATGAEAAKIVTLALAGQQNRSRFWHEFTTTRFEVTSRAASVDTGVDGESIELAAPLVFEIRPGVLRVLVPEGNVENAERRRARTSTFGDLFAVAAGREPRHALPVAG